MPVTPGSPSARERAGEKAPRRGRARGLILGAGMTESGCALPATAAKYRRRARGGIALGAGLTVDAIRDRARWGAP